MQSFAKSFYNNPKWLRTREIYLKTVDGLCELCRSEGRFIPADVVHHRTHLNADNINNPKIAYGNDNLMALCTDCHAKVHRKKIENPRYTFNEKGEIVYTIAPPIEDNT